MTKKIIVAALLVLAVTVLFAACKKDEYQVSHTVPVGTSSVEVYEDKDGNEYVTNVDGDMIPVTTDADGFYDNIENLFTETTTKKSNKNDKTTTTETITSNTPAQGENGDIESSTQASIDNTETTTKKPSETETTTRRTEDSINWDDIVSV